MATIPLNSVTSAAQPAESTQEPPVEATPHLPDLSPAEWIWYPSTRTLANTFVFFRRELKLNRLPKKAKGWIVGESRYRFEVNGQRVQWGPAPSDPRWTEVDPIDLTEKLHVGTNVIGALVLFYGHGDGTWPIGKPGLLFWLEIEYDDGTVERVVSDSTWFACLGRSWPPGQYKRWYLRSLQEEFDARLFPYGWSEATFAQTKDWLPVMGLGGSPNKPAIATHYSDYAQDLGSGPASAALRARTIPLLQESIVRAQRVAESFWIEWLRPAQEYFEVGTPNSFKVHRVPCAEVIDAGLWTIHLESQRAAAITFEFQEQMVGWPQFTIEAPVGTIIEMLVHEAHEVGGPPLLNSHFNSWTRFICREGSNTFESFDFESLRWLQLHIRGIEGKITIRDVAVRRRQFPWPHQPVLRCAEPALQRLFNASINTLHNCAQETLVDGMARERQQYSGDGGHQHHAVQLAFGETRLPARYLTTWSQGITKDGFFLDCWPAYDRLARLIERQMDLSGWGPILDHGVGFLFDCWHYYNYTDDLKPLREPYPRLLRFAQYIASIRGKDGLLTVENLGIPSVWIDHQAYRQQRHKQCAFNLYAAAALQHALAPICRAFGDEHRAQVTERFGQDLVDVAVEHFWDSARRIFINNRPWLKQEKEERYCDRSLATAILFDQCPKGDWESSLQMLVQCPPAMGLSYPCNAGWRLWALSQGGRGDIVLRDLRERWATMDSVILNNTLQEDWTARADSGQQWSHCAVAPIYVAYHGLLGLRPMVPGFRKVELRPQLGDLADLEIVAYTVQGPITFRAAGSPQRRTITVQLPSTCKGEIILPSSESVGLKEVSGPTPSGNKRYLLPSGTSVQIHLTKV